MNQYVTGALIKRLREEKGLTQQQLGEKVNVSDKTVSKWENGKGYPDISLIEPLSSALGVSVIELFAGTDVVNGNKHANMLKMKVYVCPVCGNVITSVGDAVVSCCGISLPPLEAEKPDGRHMLNVDRVEDEFYITTEHEMSKTHYISFMAAVRDDGCEIIKLYPESNSEARFKMARVKYFLYYCNRHGLYKVMRPASK